MNEDNALDVRITRLASDNTHARVMNLVAEQVGITEVRAELLPGDKLTLIRELQHGHGVIAMIGDGVNDAPALAAATVGVAMGAGGTAVALETADVVLRGDDLGKLPFSRHCAWCDYHASDRLMFRHHSARRGGRPARRQHHRGRLECPAPPRVARER